ncbi:redoxin domain-containing protein [Rhodopirellula sallentina]|uniref:Alkyl hydroperoxide reductase/ Thiol specific antioxidant/ Mal allergen n=1 Tax=Rhodopirellula sallentina SM41 TaxID=1263870 RepID=M5U839_9BACT|nr:redoxin domain-containing protein [Rhodopirellula sallentina]EMI52118.1 alkyl hydroperoxide reductase/ Thiol specific antioxidant/ Mal allergen [Rhodopirellula sallentina SM41]
MRGVSAEEKTEARQPASQKKSIKKNTFQPSPQVTQTLLPLFTAIADADVSRAKVELSVETVMHGEIVSNEKSTFQIASKFPNQYTIYHKSDEERKRLYADGKISTVALTPQAYYHLPESLNNQTLVTRTPLSLGPYPEPMLALTVAGIDPSVTFLGGMNSVTVRGKTKFRGRTDSIHVQGEQDDGVRWDLWFTDEENPRPLRLLVNLTPMLIATGQVRVPQGYELSLRYDFVSWRVTGEVDERLFQFSPPRDATQYASLEDYREKIASEIGSHPLLGKPVPEFTLTLLDGTEVTSKDLRGKVVVLDFWATWCTPCLQAMPVIKSAVEEFEDKDVVFYAVNVAENSALVKGFAGEQDWGVDVAVDPEGTMIDVFSAKKIPLTLVVAGSGIVEAAHVGYPGKDALRKQFRDELDVLTKGGRIATSETSASKKSKE